MLAAEPWQDYEKMLNLKHLSWQDSKDGPPVIAEEISVDQSVLLEEEFRNLLRHRDKQRPQTSNNANK